MSTPTAKHWSGVDAGEPFTIELDYDGEVYKQASVKLHLRRNATSGLTEVRNHVQCPDCVGAGGRVPSVGREGEAAERRSSHSQASAPVQAARWHHLLSRDARQIVSQLTMH